MVRLQQGNVRPGKRGFSDGVEYTCAQVAQASEDMVMGMMVVAVVGRREMVSMWNAIRLHVHRRQQMRST